MRKLYESLLDIDDNLDKLNWDKIDIMSLFEAKDEAEFNNIANILNIKAEKNKKNFYTPPYLIDVSYYNGRCAVQVGRGKLFYNIYWWKGQVMCDKVKDYLNKSCWEMPADLIKSYKELKKIRP